MQRRPKPIDMYITIDWGSSKGLTACICPKTTTTTTTTTTTNKIT